jgi:hypothetical protein
VPRPSPGRSPRARPRRKGSKSLPHLKFSRDKRGYEHTFVVHGERRRGRSRTRILYWFRTPPAVRVGRAALDPDAIRLIEERNPDLVFDWPRILKGEAAEPAERRGRADRHERSRPDRPPLARPAPRSEPLGDTSAATADPDAGLPEVPAEVTLAAPAEALADPGSIPPAELAPDTASGRRLGAEGLARLRARHSEVLARIDEKATDPAQQAELKSRAERLNPDEWVTDEEVAAGLEQYEAVYESLRAVVGRRRPRRNR